ncbi:hypothetical protein AAHC03_05784 [Spirometra sp. Aus1]
MVPPIGSTPSLSTFGYTQLLKNSLICLLFLLSCSLNNPHSLICGHAFCKDPCLTSVTSGQGFVRCPFCFIEVEASSVVADSVLAGRLRQYFIRKCRARPTEEMNAITGDFANLLSSENMRASSCLPDSSTENKGYKKTAKDISMSRTQQNTDAAVATSAPTDAVQSVPSVEGPTEGRAVGVASPLSDPINSRKIFVGGLNRQITSDALRAQFSRFGGVVDAIVVTDRQTGVSKGYGYVTFDLASTAEAVLATPNHQVCGGHVDVRKYQTPKRVASNQPITVPTTNSPCLSINEECETLHPIPNNVDSSNTPCRVSAADKPITRIYVGHLKPYVTRAQLIKYFCKFGQIERVFVAKQRDTHASLGFGFVQFAEASAVQKILTSGPHNIRNSELVIRPVREGGTHTNDSFEGSLSPSGSPLVSRSNSPSGQSVTKAAPSVQKTNSRCPNWLACIKGDSCPYGHPKRDCNNKRCNRGPHCCFLHPEDKILLENLRKRINLPAVTANAISNAVNQTGSA